MFLCPPLYFILHEKKRNKNRIYLIIRSIPWEIYIHFIHTVPGRLWIPYIWFLDTFGHTTDCIQSNIYNTHTRRTYYLHGVFPSLSQFHMALLHSTALPRYKAFTHSRFYLGITLARSINSILDGCSYDILRLHFLWSVPAYYTPKHYRAADTIRRLSQRTIDLEIRWKSNM